MGGHAVKISEDRPKKTFSTGDYAQFLIQRRTVTLLAVSQTSRTELTRERFVSERLGAELANPTQTILFMHKHSCEVKNM